MPEKKYICNTNKIHVKLVEVEEAKKSGVIIPDTINKEEKCRFAEVISVGCRPIPAYALTDVTEIEIKAGDTVILSKYGGVEVSKDGNELVVSYDDILLKEVK